MSVVHSPRRPALDLRTLLFPASILAILVVLLLRLWYIQVVLAPDLSERADLFGKTQSAIAAPRGLIVDRNGKLIAGVQAELVITALPGIVTKNHWVLAKLSRLLADSGVTTSPDRLLRKAKDGLYKPFVPVPIFAGAPIEVAAKLAEDSADMPGIGVDSRPTRFYPDGEAFSQMLGYVWVPSPNDVARAEREGRKPSQLVGKGGLEWVYERDLAGIDGFEAMFVDKKRRPVRVAERSGATPGAELVLGIDAELQKTAIRALGSFRGAVVAVDPSSGDVLCLASTPSFDLNLFRNGISQEDFDSLNNSPAHPFLNRAVASAFSPGSTFKIVTTAAAMKAGVFDPNRVVYCSGGYRLGRQFFKCLGHHGPVRFREAFEKSCNTYFADLSMRVGKELLRTTAIEMGFYGKTGLDLPWERSGLIPTDDWLKRVGRRWVPGYTVLTGIGQGDVLTTPLQMADMAAMVANGGTSYVPHLLHSVRRDAHSPTSEVQPRVLKSVELPGDGWRTIQDAMIGVVEHGTAAGSRIPGLIWAGKTGSAEVRGQNLTNSWFIGYAPAQNPKIAICVMVEAVGHGSEYAAPIAKQVVQRYLAPASALSNSAAAVSAQTAPAASPASR